MIVKFQFEMVAHLHDDYIEEMGNFIVEEILNEFVDNEEVFEWKFTGYEVIS